MLCHRLVKAQSELWQEKIKFDEDGNFIELIESYGFDAIYINKKAYQIEERNNFSILFEKLGYKKIFETKEVVIFKINGHKIPKNIQ